MKRVILFAFAAVFSGCINLIDKTVDVSYDYPVSETPNHPVVGGSGYDGEKKFISGIECVYVSGGTFTMGSNDDLDSYRGNARPPHKVTITKGYWVSKYPVTQAQYKAVMGNNPSYFRGGNRPVEEVSWYNADAFCKKVGGRLLTEAEWEFAARGGNKSNGYIYSGSNNLDEVGWWGYYYNGNSGYGTQPVGQKKPNELGIYDMSGNVWEWCNDWYGDYPSNAVTDPTGPSSGSNRVDRGGGWCGVSDYCRAAIRNGVSPDRGHCDLGLRVAFNSY